jgi:hypoxanthine phosphoribosyltransferase
MHPLHGISRTPGPREYLELDWEVFGELCRALAFKVARDYTPDLVIGIADAGAIPAAVIASILRNDFYSMKISRRHGDELVRQRPAVLSAAPHQAAGKRVLLVDEIATSGDTLRLALAAVRDVAPAELRTAASFVRPRGFKPDYFALETDQIVVFPWDRKVIDGDRAVVNPLYERIMEE